MINVLLFLPAESSKELLSDADSFHQMFYVSREEIVLKYFKNDQFYRERMMDATKCLIKNIK